MVLLDTGLANDGVGVLQSGGGAIVLSRRTFIQWCDYTYNPWRGCDKVSPGCKNCYIVTTPPFRISGQKHGDPRVRGSEATLNAPHTWNKRPWLCDTCGKALPANMEQPGKPYVNCWHDDRASYHRARVFLGSLMDIFDPEVKIGWFASALETVHDCQDIDFLLVSKRPELWSKLLVEAMRCPMSEACYKWMMMWLGGQAPRNLWMITSTENQAMADKRIPELLRIPAVVHGLSCEPLLGPIELLRSLNGYDRLGYRKPFEKSLKSEGVDWVIAGGESGPGARPMTVEWMSEIQRQCKVAGIAYFAKQLGSFPATENANLHDWPEGTRMTVCYGYPQAAGGRALLKDKKGGDPEEWPPEMRVREWPKVQR